MLTSGLALGAGALVTSCSVGSPTTANTPKQQGQPSSGSTVSIVPLPKGVVGAGQLQPNGTLWVLSGTTTVKALSQINLSTKRPGQTVGVSSDAHAVAQSSTGLLAVGISTATTGAVELRNGASAAVTGTVPVGASVHALAFGADGVTLYVLDGTASSASVSVVNTSTEKVVASFGVPADAVGLAVDPSQTSLWTVEQSGNVQQTSLQSSKPVQQLPIGGPGIALALSPSGNTLYVLKGTPAISNIAVIATNTDTTQRVMGAAAASVGLVPAPDGTMLYDVVGAPAIGNIQAISLIA